MPQCPRCKGDMPLLSKICPICGYVVEGDEATPNAADQINSLEQLVLQIKGLPRPTFLASVRDLLGIIVLILTVYFLVMAYITGAIAFKILGGVFLVILQYFLGRLVASWFKPSIKDEINRIKNEFEYNERIARRSFGKDHETTLPPKSSTLSVSGANRTARFSIHGSQSPLYSSSRHRAASQPPITSWRRTSRRRNTANTRARSRLSPHRRTTTNTWAERLGRQS